MAHLTPQECEELFGMLGGMAPSNRLPEQLGQRWEKQRVEFEQALRDDEEIPKEAVTMSVSPAVVMLPMKGGQRAEKRAAAVSEGRRTRGPAGHEEAGCATLSYLGGDGQRLSTVRLGRMPEKRKATLKKMLAEEVAETLRWRPELKLITVADGARDNWDNLDEQFPQATPVVDFYHAAERLKEALEAAYGETSPKGRVQYEKLRHQLLEQRGGVEKVVRALVRLRDTHPRSRKIEAELWCFRRNRHVLRAEGGRISDRLWRAGGSVQDAGDAKIAPPATRGAVTVRSTTQGNDPARSEPRHGS